MKKIICILTAITFVFSNLSGFVSFASGSGDLKNENVIINGDFEGSDTLIEDLAFSGMPNWKNTSSGWISYSQWHSQITIKPTDEDENNHVLSFDGFTDRSNGVMQVLPTSRKCTGVYNIKFKARMVGNRSNKADVSVYLQYVYNKNGGYVGNTNMVYRATSRGAKETSKYIFTLDDNEWHDYDINVDLMANDGAYKNFTNDIAAVRLVIRQAYGTANKVGVDPDYNSTEVQFDDIEVTMPEPLMVEEFMIDDPQNVSLESAVIPVKFNYDEQIYSSSLDGVKLYNPLGKEVECNFDALNGILNVKPKNLEPDTEYRLVVDSVASKTPVYDPTKSPSWLASEERYVSMIEPAEFNFKTVKKVDVLSKSCSSGTAVVKLRNNRGTEDTFFLVVYNQNNGAVKSKSYYKKITLLPSETKDILFENVNLSSDNIETEMIDLFGGELNKTIADTSKLNIDFSTVNQTMGAFGYMSDKYCGKEIMAFFISPAEDGKAQDISMLNDSPSGETDKICAISRAFVDADAEFIFNPVPVNKSGNYRVIAKLDGEVFADEEKFFSSKEDNDAFFRKVNAVTGTLAQKADTLFDIFETEHREQKIRYSEEFYDKLSIDSRKLFCLNMAEKIPFADLDDFISEFSDQSLTVALTKEQTPEIMADIIGGKFEKEPAKRVIKLLALEKLYDTTVYKEYLSFPDEIKIAFCNAFIENNTRKFTDMRNAEDFINGFAIVMINENINNAVLHKDISEILNKYSDVLKDVDFKAYNKLGLKQSEVNDGIKSNTKYKLNEFIQYVNELIKSAEKDSGSSSGGGNGGGSSSGSGKKKSGSSGFSSSSPMTPVTVAVPDKVYFKDMDGYSWAKQAVNGLYERKIISGREDEIFDPSGLITREEFLKLVIGAAGLKPEKESEAFFDDVIPGQWYEGYVNCAYNHEIAKGMGDGIFGIGNNISRQDMFVMCSYLVNNVKSPYSDGCEKFADKDDISDYALGSIAKLAGLSVISGNEHGMVNPKAFATRAEAAKIIYNIMGITGRL